MDWFGNGQTVLAVTTLVKILVALVKLAVDAPRWTAPLLAALAGPLLALLFLVAQGTALAPPVAAQAVLQGVLAAGLALGVEQIETRVMLREARVAGLR